MFKRSNQSYMYNRSAVRNIIQDDASPLNRITEIVPCEAKVMDIGSGSGVLSDIFSEKNKNVVIDGVEPNEYAARLAKRKYRNFYQTYIQEKMDVFAYENYDYVILADVLEHVNNPLELLLAISENISKKTRIIISLPNVAFGAVRLALLDGHFNYVDSGILEKTHLRFFTLETIKKLVNKTDLKIEEINHLQRTIFTAEIPIRFSFADALSFYRVCNDVNAWTYQFLIVLDKAAETTITKYYGNIPRYPMWHFLKSIFLKR